MQRIFDVYTKPRTKTKNMKSEETPENTLEFRLISSYPTPEEINAKYKPYNDLMIRYCLLDMMNYDEIVQFENDFIEYANYYQRMSGLHGFGLWPEDFERIAERKRQLVVKKDLRAKLFYDHKLVIHDEEINGYKLLDVDGDNIMDFEEFKVLCVRWDEPDITKEEFDEWLDKHLCSDWAKQDRHGECYGGFWKCPKGSYENKNAYLLTLEDNIKGLHDLPYPRCIIVKTIESGCANRQESVAYSNFVCEWIKRKKDTVFTNDIPSLQSLAKVVALDNGEHLPNHLIDI